MAGLEMLFNHPQTLSDPEIAKNAVTDLLDLGVNWPGINLDAVGDLPVFGVVWPEAVLGEAGEGSGSVERSLDYKKPDSDNSLEVIVSLERLSSRAHYTHT
jgi:hypothetical protein